MAVKLGNGKWAVKENNLLAYNDNSGQFFNKEFDFTRGSSATYVGKDGLIKTAGLQDTNLVQNGDFSELGSELVTNGDFDNGGANWVNINDAVFENSTVIFEDNAKIYQNVVSDLSKFYKISIDLNSVANDGLQILAGSGNSFVSYSVNDIINNGNKIVLYSKFINNGTLFVYSKTANTSAVIDNVSVKQVDPNDEWSLGTGWSYGDGSAVSTTTSSNLNCNSATLVVGKTYKFSIDSEAVSSGSYSFLLRFNSTNTDIGVINSNGSHVFYAVADSTSFRVQTLSGGSTSFSIDNVSVQEVQVNTPRIDFSDSADGALLLEPQSTNLLSYSEAFGNSYWNKSGNVVIDIELTISPSGKQNASKFTFDGTTNGRVEKDISVINGTQYTFSVWLKNDDLADPTQVWIGLSTSNQGEYVTVTNEWKRFTTTQVSNGTTEYPRIQTSEVGSIFAWGGQLEQQSYPTSYIPTQGSASTRIAETCDNSGSAQDFNSEEGVLYAETHNVSKEYNNNIALTDGSNNQRVQMYFNKNALSLMFFIKVNGTVVGTHTVSASGINYEDTNKIAIKYKTNDMSFWLNGTEVATDTSGTMFSANTLTQLGFNSGSDGTFYGETRDLRVYNTALSDEELHKLTKVGVDPTPTFYLEILAENGDFLQTEQDEYIIIE